MLLKNRFVLITGASSGIGEATAHEIARRGGIPILVARREAELLRVAKAIRERFGIEAIPFAADITSGADRNRIALFAAKKGLHVLINNAGITAHGRFDETDPSVLRNTMEINFFAAIDLTRLLIPVMKNTPGEKSILLVSTPSGLYGMPGRFAYSASKAAAQAVIESLRIELKSYNIHTVIFCPGYTRTALRTSGLSQDGSPLKEGQAEGAQSPEHTARLLVNAIAEKRRYAFTDLNGLAVFLLRSLCPALLEKVVAKKLKRDYEED